MPTHFEESLQRDIDRIRGKLTEMSGLGEQALRHCVKALVENDRQLAYSVILRDQYIDELEKEVDRLCLEFLVRQQPAGSLLRFAYSTIRINLDLERVGDYAESIARQMLKLNGVPAVISSDRFAELANLSVSMLHDAIQAFVEQDAELARKTMEIEEVVDALKSKLNKDLVSLYRESKIPFEALNPLMMIARRLERVSDQARNICMEVLYLCTGAPTKHPDSDVFRILFVDEDNGGRSQMAEAIANSLNQPKFIFSSAGLDPKAVPPATRDFMKSKGLDLAHLAPKAINQVPHLDHYQVVVSLAKEVRKAFPSKPRKMILLDWSLPDPAEVQGTPEQVQAAYEATYQSIENHIRDLVSAISGVK